MLIWYYNSKHNPHLTDPDQFLAKSKHSMKLIDSKLIKSIATYS